MPSHGHELGELLAYFELPGDHVLDGIDLALEVVDEAYARKDHGPRLRVRKEASHFGVGNPFYVLALHPEAEITGEDVLDA